MKIHIRAAEGELVERLRSHVETRLAFALGQFAERISLVLVRFSEVGGETKCSIEVTLNAHKVVAEDVQKDTFVAVDNVAARVSRSVGRALERDRNWDVSPLIVRKKSPSIAAKRRKPPPAA